VEAANQKEQRIILIETKHLTRNNRIQLITTQHKIIRLQTKTTHIESIMAIRYIVFEEKLHSYLGLIQFDIKKKPNATREIAAVFVKNAL